MDSVTPIVTALAAKDLVVVVPAENPPIEALQVRILVDYVQTARMTLGGSFPAMSELLAVVGRRSVLRHRGSPYAEIRRLRQQP